MVCLQQQGEGIGIDRLINVLTNTQNIREVILFPILKPKNNLDVFMLTWVEIKKLNIQNNLLNILNNRKIL